MRSLDSREFDVLFLGTTKGRILKVYDLSQPTRQDSSRTPSPVLVESVQVFPPDVPVRNLMLARDDARPGRLVALSEHEVLSMPLSRCGHPEVARSCGRCLALRDPYCAWDHVDERCIELQAAEAGSTTDHLWQELEEGRRDECDVLSQTLLLAGEAAGSHKHAFSTHTLASLIFLHTLKHPKVK